MDDDFSRGGGAFCLHVQWSWQLVLRRKVLSFAFVRAFSWAFSSFWEGSLSRVLMTARAQRDSCATALSDWAFLRCFSCSSFLPSLASFCCTGGRSFNDTGTAGTSPAFVFWPVVG